MSTDGRAVHLVGSIPADDAEEAMRTVTQRLGDCLQTLPDGETGERRNWCGHIVESLRTHPDLEVARQGDWSDYDHVMTLKVRAHHRLRGDAIDLGHVAAFDASLPVFSKIRADTGLDDLAFQMGIPGDLDIALFTLGSVGAFRHRGAFTDATLREIYAIHAKAGSSVVFQLELPVELVFVTQMPRPLRPAMAAFLARGVRRLARFSPQGARFGIHLCVGDLGNQALGRMRDAQPLVVLANAILRGWPSGRPLEYLHAPFAAGDEPAPHDQTFYEPLSQLRLPTDVRFIAGFVHEASSADEHRRILGIIESQLGRRVDVATACGLGRRTPEAAATTMDRAAELVHDPV